MSLNLTEIRQNLAEHKHDAVLITRNNQFLGQDVPKQENRILALTGFSGSAGTLIITPDKAFLFVDGRYEIQAARQIDPITTEVVCNCSPLSWIEKNLPENAKIEYNPWCVCLKEINSYTHLLPKLKLLAKPELFSTETANVFAHEKQYCGRTHDEKLADALNYLSQHHCQACLITAADSVSWLTNLRSDALPDTPIVRAMALIRQNEKIVFFADNLTFPSDSSYTVLPFSRLEKEIAACQNLTFAVDDRTTPDAIRRIMEKHNISTRTIADPCLLAKACKNTAELNGMINAHLNDGTAVCQFLYWLESNRTGLTELGVVDQIHKFRRQQSLFYSDSFPTIAAAGSNAAVIHYQPTPDSNRKLDDNGLLLLDSGGQYFNGTTDITRTIALGCPSPEMIEKYTIVLKAHIALASARFPKGTKGTALDAICRSVLWRHGLDYKHGTGHGVGCFLNVHVGPQNISPNGSAYPLQENMVVSIEPGYYRENAFGIRIENLASVTTDQSTGMLKFEILTLAPLDKRLINKYLLSQEETEWVDNYHKEVVRKISPRLTTDEQRWLREACSSL